MGLFKKKNELKKLIDNALDRYKRTYNAGYDIRIKAYHERDVNGQTFISEDDAKRSDEYCHRARVELAAKLREIAILLEQRKIS